MYLFDLNVLLACLCFNIVKECSVAVLIPFWPIGIGAN